LARRGGGNWISDPQFIRASVRIKYDPADAFYRFGFRCVAPVRPSSVANTGVQQTVQHPRNTSKGCRIYLVQDLDMAISKMTTAELRAISEKELGEVSQVIELLEVEDVGYSSCEWFPGFLSDLKNRRAELLQAISALRS
jgi:hypothetical protein